jgi:transcriptional regulator with XRE-family HTH domain
MGGKTLSGKALAARLVEAMDTPRPKITSSALADACNVSPQAVNGWRKNGRIRKHHLPIVAKITGQPLRYFVDADYDPASLEALADQIAVRWTALPDFLRPNVTSALEQAERAAREQPGPVAVETPAPLPHLDTFPQNTRERAKSRRSTNK